MTPRKFRARLGGDAGELFVEIPFDVKQVYGRARAPVVVSINAVTFRSTVAIYDGRYYVPVRKDRRAAAGVAAGDEVQVSLAFDNEPRTVELPADLLAALAQHPAARARWDLLAHSHQREHVEALLGAKKPETRARRLIQIVASLTAEGARQRAGSRRS